MYTYQFNRSIVLELQAENVKMSTEIELLKENQKLTADTVTKTFRKVSSPSKNEL